MNFRIHCAALAAAALVGLAGSACADNVADFYRGKHITLVIGYGPGGGYDLYARMLGRFIGGHIPGNPLIVPQNMPGAGSRSAANWLYKVAPQDGSVIVCLSQATPPDQALSEPGVQFDARKFNWIGNLNVVNNILYVSAASGVATFADAKVKPLAIGATGAASPSVPTRRFRTLCSVANSGSSPAIRAAATSISRLSVTRSTAAAAIPGIP